MGDRRTPTASKNRLASGADAMIRVPAVVVTKVENSLSVLWDKNCPFASLYLWICAFLALYYLFWMPDVSVEVDMGNQQVKTRHVDKKLRGLLFMGTIASAFIGHKIIRNGCVAAGSGWSFLWFLVALALIGVVISLFMMASGKYTLAGASDMLRQIDRQQGK
jgi:uncharacterized membrane protein YeiB